MVFFKSKNVSNTLRKHDRKHQQGFIYRSPQDLFLNLCLIFFSCDDHFVCGDLSSYAAHTMGGCVTSFDIPSGKQL